MAVTDDPTEEWTVALGMEHEAEQTESHTTQTVIDLEHEVPGAGMAASTAAGQQSAELEPNDLFDTTGWEEAEEDEDIEAEMDESGFLHVDPEWLGIWGRMEALMSSVGLVGERLVLQEPEVPRMLTQLLAELELQVNKPARDYLTGRLYAKISVAEEEETRRKRFKGNPNLAMQRISDSKFGRLDQAMDIPLQLFFFPPKGLKSRRQKALVPIGEVLTREQAEQRERLRWEETLANILLEGQTPTAELAKKSSNPLQVLSRSVGKTRISTLKSYLKRWLKMVCWLRRATGHAWPRDIEQALDYVEVLAEDLHPTVPQATLQALQWMEKAGGYFGEEAIFSHPLVVKAFDNLTVEAGMLGKPRKQSPRFPFVLLAALELFCTNPDTPIMKRIHGNSILLRSFGTLRFDDIQNMDRRRIRKLGSIYVTELLKTKTSGPGKRNTELPVAISADATVLNTDWTLRLLEDLEEACPERSDFLLFSSSYDGQHSKGKMKTYEESAADTRQIVSCLRIPVLKNGKWVPSNDPVIPAVCIGAIQEHGGRSVLPSVAVFTEPEKTKRDMLGKWLVTGGSVDYTRSYRAIIAKMQTEIIRAVRSGRMLSELREDDIGDLYVRHLVEVKGWDSKAARDVIGTMLARWDVFYQELATWEKERVESLLPGIPSMSDPLIELALQNGGEENPTLPYPSPTALPKSLPVPRIAVNSGKKACGEYRYMIVYTKKRRVACLHKARDGCAWTRIDLNEFTVHDIVVPEQYNKRCRLCWSTDKKEDESSDTSSPSD